jgi:anaerobic selenocysteine-containing dehydrogenase
VLREAGHDAIWAAVSSSKSVFMNTDNESGWSIVPLSCSVVYAADYNCRVFAPNVVRHSVCALDCPDACSLLINVENEIGSRLRGNPDHPVTRGFLCAKVAKYLDREYSPDRLLYPLRRTGAKGSGEFTRVSWDEALDSIADRLTTISREHGPESILPYSYGGTMGYLQGSGMDRRFFHRLGASRLDRTICSAPPLFTFSSTSSGWFWWSSSGA